MTGASLTAEQALARALDWAEGRLSHCNLGWDAPYTPDVIAVMDAQEVVKWSALAQALAKDAALISRLEAQERALRKIRAKVDEQADDEALWALGIDGELPISEAYLQQELRALHAVVESVTALTADTGARAT